MIHTVAVTKAAPPPKCNECARRTQRRRRTILNGTQHRHPVAAARRPTSASSIDVNVHRGARLSRARSFWFAAAVFALLAVAAAAADATADTALVDYTNYTLSAARYQLAATSVSNLALFGG